MVYLSLSPVLFDACLFFAGLFVLGSLMTVRPRKGTRPIEALVDALTMDEKLRLLHGAEDPTGEAERGYVPGIPRLDIPPLRLTDGIPDGRTEEPATAFPPPIAVSASFDPGVARRVGETLAREGRARGQNVFLGPRANVLRVPQAGRTHELFGEDPYLIARMVAETVRGIETEGMIATVKHFAVHNFERNRDRISAEVDERTLRELYLPGFRSAVDAGVGSAMGAPNRVNGTYACDHEWLLTEVLRSEFGFSGWVMSDWFARHSLEAFEAGLDQEMPGLGDPGDPQAVYFGEPLRRAVQYGRISEREVTASVRRILRQMKRIDLLGDSVSEAPSVDETRSAAVAREVAVAGAVLLRNEHDLLPLAAGNVSSLAVIGPTAERSKRGEEAEGSTLAALRQRLEPEVSIRHEEGIDLEGLPVPSSVLSPSPSLSVDGLRCTTTDDSFQLDPTINFTGRDALPAGTSWTWTGILTAPQAGTYTLRLRTEGGTGRLQVQGETVLCTSPGEGASETFSLEAQETLSLTVKAEGSEQGTSIASGAPLQVRFTWVPPNRRQVLLDRAVAAAGNADAVLVFGYDDRPCNLDCASLSLSRSQEALIQAVADANDSTGVVLNTRGPIVMPWIEDVQAVLQMWQAGQGGAEGTAAVLTGEVAPGGRLPVTFPCRVEDTPTASPDRYPGTNGKASYSEGVFVGYRWYDEEGIEPLFPFGHGLTYTSFEYSGLSIRERGNGYEVRFRVQNTGKRTGTAVPQVYVGRPADPPAPMPPKELVGFARMTLQPGEGATATVHLDRRAFSYWSSEDEKWCLASGQRPISVGASSRDIRLEDRVSVG